MRNRIVIKRPTPDEAAALLAPTAETAPARISKPARDYLLANLKTDALVSAYVTNRITSELVRLSKMPSGPGGKLHEGPSTPGMIRQRREAAKSRWSGDERESVVKVRVYDEPHNAYLALTENKFDRPKAAGELIADACAVIDCDDLRRYAAEHADYPQKFASIPASAVEAAKAVGGRAGVSFTKVVNYVLAQEC